MAKQYGMTVDWHPEKWRKELDSLMFRNVERAAIILTDDVRAEFPPGGHVGTRSGYGGMRIRSEPDKRPRVQSGTLQKSILHEHRRDNPLVAFVGSDIGPDQGQEYSYAWYLEWGTPGKQMAPRPYLRASLYECRQKLIEALTRGMHRS